MKFNFNLYDFIDFGFPLLTLILIKNTRLEKYEYLLIIQKN